jgi:transcriptional regulator with XRE-family HTH domain
MNRTSIDVEGLFASLNAAREARGSSWRTLAKEIGVSPSLLSRLGNGLKPDADSFATLVQWLGLPAEQFFVDPKAQTDRPEPELMAQLAPLLRARHDLSKADVDYLEEIIAATVRRTQSKL